MKRSILFTLLLIIFSSTLIAQTTTNSKDSTNIKDSIKKTAVTFLAGPIYVPVLHYYGRTDSLKSSALLPTIYIQFDSIGLYVTATAVLLNDQTQTLGYAGTITEAGYKFGQKVKGFGGNVYANKFFYNTTQLPQSALQEQAGVNLYYLYKYINFTGSAGLAFSNNTDVLSSVGVNHTFRKKRGNNIYLAIPTFVANAGTQNFINASYKTSTLPLIPPQEVLQSNRQFTLLDYELTMPLILARKHIFVIATPSYIIPENIVSVPNHPELSEKGSDLFYINLTFLYSFKVYKRTTIKGSIF
jgi:hypothetical protein